VSKVPGTFKNERAEIELPTDELGPFPWPEDFPPVKVGVIAGEQSRYSAFTISLAMTMGAMPPNSALHFTQGVDVPGNCNTVVRSLKPQEQFVWILGDDHIWPRGTLPRLLAHDVDIIVPHCLKRIPPWPPVVYSHQDADGWFVAADLPEHGLTEIHAAGSAGMLIKREVLEAIGDPYFRPDPNGTGLNEDLYFCQRARELGFKIYCDPGIPFGHIGTYHILPTWGDNGWDVKLVHGEDSAIRQPGIHRLTREYERRKAEAEAAA